MINELKSIEVQTRKYTGKYIDINFEYSNCNKAIITLSSEIRTLLNINISTLWLQTPTGNCQLSSFYEINNLLTSILDGDIQRLSKDNRLKLIKLIFIEFFSIISSVFGYDKRIIMFDVTAYYNDIIKLLFNKDYYVMYNNYTSSNGTDMHMYLINLKYVDLKIVWDIKLEDNLFLESKTEEVKLEVKNMLKTTLEF